MILSLHHQSTQMLPYSYTCTYHFRSLCNNLLSKHKPIYSYHLHQNFHLSMFWLFKGWLRRLKHLIVEFWCFTMYSIPWHNIEFIWSHYIESTLINAMYNQQSRWFTPVSILYIVSTSITLLSIIPELTIYIILKWSCRPKCSKQKRLWVKLYNCAFNNTSAIYN